jgi:hypothetical protein
LVVGLAEQVATLVQLRVLQAALAAAAARDLAALEQQARAVAGQVDKEMQAETDIG